MSTLNSLRVKTPILVLSHNPKSHSARLLGRRFGHPVFSLASLVPELQENHPKGSMTVLNWGSAKTVQFPEARRTLNAFKAVAGVSDKLRFFKTAVDAGEDGPRVPQFWLTGEEALTAMRDNPKWTVLGRDLHGSCGEDIAFYDEAPADWNAADFYVRYIPKKDEFRIHVFKFRDGFRVLTQQRKALRSTDPVTEEPIDPEKVDFRIRNHRNGFVFQRNDITVPNDVIQQSIKALAVSGLDFGAIDTIWNEKSQKAYVLEINTAPGLEGTTVDEYAEAFKEMAAEGSL